MSDDWRDEYKDKLRIVFNIVANCECLVCGAEWDEECLDTSGVFECECGETITLS